MASYGNWHTLQAGLKKEMHALLSPEFSPAYELLDKEQMKDDKSG